MTKPHDHPFSLVPGGASADRNWVAHEELMRGARLEFEMSDQPNLKRGIAPEAAPYSFSTDPEAPGFVRGVAQ